MKRYIFLRPYRNHAKGDIVAELRSHPGFFFNKKYVPGAGQSFSEDVVSGYCLFHDEVTFLQKNDFIQDYDMICKRKKEEDTQWVIDNAERIKEALSLLNI